LVKGLSRSHNGDLTISASAKSQGSLALSACRRL
jgi:hypothetical protein